MQLLTTAEASDEALMVRAQADDVEAFGYLYDRYASRAFRLACAVCHDTGRAEDVVQEGFLAIWRNRMSYRSETGSFKAWSMRIVQNRAIDSYRRAARPQDQLAVLDEERPDESAASPPEEAIAHSQRDALRASLDRLPDAQAEVITLAFFGGLSHAEIATELSLPAGTVKGRMRLGLKKLRGQIALQAS